MMPSEDDPWMSLVKTKRNWTGLYFARIESGIWTVKVSQGADWPWTAPLQECRLIHPASRSRTSRLPKSYPDSVLNWCLKESLTGLAAAERFTKFCRICVQLLSYP